MPQSVVEGSICQPTPFLYEQVEEPTDKTIETSIDGEPIFIKPSIRADRLVAYLEALKQDYELPEMAFIDTQDEDDSEDVTLAEESTTKEVTVGVPTWLADQIASA